MLRRIDRVLTIVAVVAAAGTLIALLTGPAVVANDDSSPGAKAAGAAVYGSGAGANGAAVFKSNCGSCHTLSAAGTNGSVGPNLDQTSLSASDIEAKVRAGGGGMPAFGGQLSDAEIKAVAAYVDAVR
jgi:mono/diheme cytochrome c family protein